MTVVALDFAGFADRMRVVNDLVRSPRGRPGEARVPLCSLVPGSEQHRRFLEGVLLRPGQVAAMFQVTRRAVADWAKAGLLPWMETPGGHRRFRAGDVQRLIDSLTVSEVRSYSPPPLRPR